LTTEVKEKLFSTTETAKLIREALAKKYPLIKFSVRSRSYAGGSSIDVSWTFGPTINEVDQYLGPYESRGFDGSIDLSYLKDQWLLPDGTVILRSSQGSSRSGGSDPEINNPPPPGAVPVRFMVHYVMTSRHYGPSEESMELMRTISRDLCKLQQIEYRGDNTINLFGSEDMEHVDQHAWRLLNLTSFESGEKYAGIRPITPEELEKPWLGGLVNRCFVIVKKDGTPVREIEAPGQEKVSGVTMRENKELNGLELVFPGKPDQAIINKMKDAGWRWHRYNQYWYNRDTPVNRQFAAALMEGKDA
jgi:hypothetical protein